MTEKEQYQDNIRWAQALNCATEVLNPIMRRGQAKTEAEMKQAITFWREWFYNELLKPSPSEVFGEVPVGNPIPKFDYTDKKTLTEDQYQGYGTPKAPLAGGRYKGKKIDLRGEPKSRDVGRDDSERDTFQDLPPDGIVD